MSEQDKLLPLLKVRPSDLAPRALVVGDPQRAAAAAELLDDAREIGYFREYRTFVGTFNGQPITVSSHGVGGAGASICFEELMQAGVSAIIRAGTCGAMRPGIKDGELVLGVGAIREDGTSDKLVPLAFPAVADRRVVAALEAAATAQNVAPLHEGIVLTQGHFYHGILPPTLDMWLASGLNVCAVEMELATLLVIASLHNARAGGILTSDGNLTEEADPNAYDPHRTVVKEGVNTMLNVALEALSKLD